LILYKILKKPEIQGDEKLTILLRLESIKSHSI